MGLKRLITERNLSKLFLDLRLGVGRGVGGTIGVVSCESALRATSTEWKGRIFLGFCTGASAVAGLLTDFRSLAKLFFGFKDCKVSVERLWVKLDQRSRGVLGGIKDSDE